MAEPVQYHQNPWLNATKRTQGDLTIYSFTGKNIFYPVEITVNMAAKTATYVQNGTKQNDVTLSLDRNGGIETISLGGAESPFLSLTPNPRSGRDPIDGFSVSSRSPVKQGRDYFTFKSDGTYIVSIDERGPITVAQDGSYTSHNEIGTKFGWRHETDNGAVLYRRTDSLAPWPRTSSENFGVIRGTDNPFQPVIGDLTIKNWNVTVERVQGSNQINEKRILWATDKDGKPVKIALSCPQLPPALEEANKDRWDITRFLKGTYLPASAVAVTDKDDKPLEGYSFDVKNFKAIERAYHQWADGQFTKAGQKGIPTDGPDGTYPCSLPQKTSEGFGLKYEPYRRN